MDSFRSAYHLLLTTVVLCSFSGQMVSAQMSGIVPQQSLIDYMNQIINTAPNTATIPPPYPAGPTPPPLPPPQNSYPPNIISYTQPPQTTPVPYTSSSNQVNSLYQQIIDMANRMNGGSNTQQLTTPYASIISTPFHTMTTTTAAPPPPPTPGSVPFDPWMQNQNTHNTNTAQQSHASTGTSATGNTGFRLTSWEQYQPHPDPWSQNKPATTPRPEPKLPPTPAQLMLTYVPLQMQQRMMEAGRTGFIKPTLYFEEHGCVDPRMHLPPGTLSPGLVLSCTSRQSQQVCAQVGHHLGAGGEAPAGGFDMNSFVMNNMPGYKKLLEKCLSPRIMSQMQMNQQMMIVKMMSNMFNRNSGGHGGMNSAGGHAGTNVFGPAGGHSSWGTQSPMPFNSNPFSSAPSSANITMGTTPSPLPTYVPPEGPSATNAPPQTGSGTTQNPMDSIMSAMQSMLGSMGSTSAAGRRKRQATTLGSLYDALFRGRYSTQGTLFSGVATIPPGGDQMNSISGSSSPFGASSGNLGGQTASTGSLLGSSSGNQAGSLPVGAALPSGPYSTGSSVDPTHNMGSNAGSTGNTGMGSMMNMMSNMMSSLMGGSLPVGAASHNPTGGMSSFFGSMFGGSGAHSSPGSGHAGPEPGIEQCMNILPMLLANAGVEGGMGSPEAMEMLVDIRRQMLPMECQEFPMMNFRMCCPGHVTPPTFQEMLMAGMNAGAK